MQLPSGLQRARLVVATSAVINTTVQTALVAAPGNGLRYRVWAVKLSLGATSQAPANTRIAIVDAGGGSAAFDLSVVGFGSASFTAPGGSTRAANTALEVVHQSSVASISIVVEVYYTLEAA